MLRARRAKGGSCNDAFPDDIAPWLPAQGDTVIPSSLKGIRIKAGSPAGRVTASGGLAVISCLAEGVLIEGLSLENKGECSCVEVSRGASLTLVGCTIVAHGGSGVDVCGGKVEASNCTFSNCGQYGAIAREGGSFQGHTVTLASNGKTGLLARGQGSSVSVDTNSFMGKNGGNGVGCDGGGHVELKNSSVADNKLVGVMVGPVGTALLSSCEVTGSGMHGVAVSSGTVKASDTQFRKSRQLGAMVRFPPDHLCRPPPPLRPPLAGHQRGAHPGEMRDRGKRSTRNPRAERGHPEGHRAISLTQLPKWHRRPRGVSRCVKLGRQPQ